MNIKLLLAGLSAILLVLNVFFGIIWRYLPEGSDGSSGNLSTIIAAIIIHTALLAYGYVLLREVASAEKSQWYLVLISTAVLSLSPVIETLIMSFTTQGANNPEMHLRPMLLVASFISSFLMSLGVVFLIAQIHKRRTGFEVE